MNRNVSTLLGSLVLGMDHVACAVENIDASITYYVDGLGFELLANREVVGDHTGMAYAILKLHGACIVLVQGNSPESQVTKYIAEFGPGIHHIALSVSDLDAALAKVVGAGGFADTPIISDVGIRQTFLRRDPISGVRIELIERQNAPFSDKNVEGLFRALEARDLY